VTSTRVETSLRLPWSARVVTAVPLPPAVTGLLVAGGVFFAFLIWAAAHGWLSSASEVGLHLGTLCWLEAVQCVMIGYAPVAAAIALRGALRDLDELRPTLDLPGPEFERRRAELVRFSRTPLVVMSLIGGALSLSVLLHPSGWVGGVRPPVGDPLFIWALARNTLMFVLYAQTVYMDIEVARRLSRIGEQFARVDLLDLSPLRPLTRRGLRSVLLWVILTVLASILFLAPWSADPTAFFLVLLVAIAVAALLLPVWGAHRRIAAARRDELARVRAAIRAGRETLLGPPGAASAARTPPLADLLAYEARIASAPTWPFDVSTLVRFGLYVALGLGSWLGAALVERFLDLALE
jgi:hypothetical protein